MHTVSFAIGDAQSTMWVNTTQQVLTATQSPVLLGSKNNATTIKQMGIFTNHTPNGYDGSIYEIVWYNRKLTDTEIESVQHHLIEKHGIPDLP